MTANMISTDYKLNAASAACTNICVLNTPFTFVGAALSPFSIKFLAEVQAIQTITDAEHQFARSRSSSIR